MKAAGLIDKLPGRPPGLKRQVAEAEKAMDRLEARAVDVKRSGIAEELAVLSGESIKVMREVVRRKRPYKGGDQHKLKQMQLDAAGKALNAQLRADENVLRARQQGTMLAPVLAALLGAAGEALPVVDAADPEEEATKNPAEAGFPAKPKDAASD